MRIVLAEDHVLVRQGLRAYLEAEQGFSIVGDVGDGLAAVDMVEALRPDVLIVDVMMPGLGGLEVTRKVRDRVPETRVIVLSMHDNEAYVLQALSHGAVGYVLKEGNMSDLIQAVREAIAGRHYLSPPLSERAIELYERRARESTFDSYATLTEREREVLHLATEGQSSTEIGLRLSISPRTAEAHRANLMRKLGLKSQTDLVRYAIKRGILPLEG